jgi:hypothetical protein
MYTRMLQKSPKNLTALQQKQNFSCEHCDYHTSKKADFMKHEKTRKHCNMVTFGVTEKSPSAVPMIHTCKFCDKEYNNRVSLWRHEKKCNMNETPPIQEDDIEADIDVDVEEDEEAEPNVMMVIDPERDNPMEIFTKEMILDLLRQNKELHNVLLEQNNKLLEQNSKLIERSNNVVQNNTMNAQFNLNFFLTEKCKEAINIIDFVNSLQVQVKDLERTGQLGYVKGISQIFLNGLRELDVYTRPIHCTDLKREVIYVKDNDKWEKETEDKSILKRAVRKIAMKNLQQLPAWQRENPECENTDSEESETFLILSQQSLGGVTTEEDEKFQEKIIRNVLKDVVLEKRML